MKNHLHETDDLSFNIDELYNELTEDFEPAGSQKIDADYDPDTDPEFVADFIKSMFVNEIYKVMELNNITQSDLAKKMNVKRQYVNKILNEDNDVNFTIQTMASISCALGKELQITMLNDKNEDSILHRNTNKIKFNKKKIKENISHFLLRERG